MFVQRTKIGSKHSMAPVFKISIHVQRCLFQNGMNLLSEEFHEPVMDYPDGKWLAHIWI